MAAENCHDREAAMKLKEPSPGSPEAKRRDDLLAIMRDETKPEASGIRQY